MDPGVKLRATIFQVSKYQTGYLYLDQAGLLKVGSAAAVSVVAQRELVVENSEHGASQSYPEVDPSSPGQGNLTNH